MVHLNAHHDTPPVTNAPHQHAFTIVGTGATFAVHMTQYHCEVHKYQLIFRFSLGAEDQRRLAELKTRFPNDCFVLCNHEEDRERHIELMTVPDLASGRTPRFLGNVYQGMRPIRPEEFADHDFFPWSSKRCRPVMREVEVHIDRVTLFRPFSHGDSRPAHPSYFLWGDGDEAHMTNIQTAALFSGPFDAPAYGPDFDHVMSLAGKPDWLDGGLMQAGIVASAADIDMGAPETWPLGPPFAEGAPVRLLYRGLGPSRTVTAGPTYLAATAVCNSPEADPHHGQNLWISEMPREFWT